LPVQALYLKWRPRSFEHIIGQQHITQSLRNAIIQDRVGHAYLFNGPRGTGKTTMARILAKGVNCLHPDPAQRPCDECQYCEAVNEGRFLDLIEIDAASHNGVDDVRDLREKIAFAPSEGRYKVYIIDEVHRFSGAAFDALLKTLEEPPEHAIFILATTELDKVPPTIKSRSQLFQFRRVSLSDVADRLQMIVDSEGIQAEREALELVARQGTGSVRDSISLLDQLINDPDLPITLEGVEQVLGAASSRAIGSLVQSILNNDVAAGLDLLNQAIDQGADPAQLGRQIVEYLRNLLLIQTGGPALVDASSEIRAVLTQQASQIGRASLLHAVRAFNTAVAELKGGWQPQLPLELALIDCTRSAQAELPDSLPTTVPPAAPTAKPKAPTSASKAAPKAAAPAAAGQEPIAGTVSFSDVQRAWSGIVQKAKETNQPLAATLMHATLKSLDEGRVLVLAVDSAVFKNKLEAEDKRNLLSQIIKAALNVALQIKVVIATEGEAGAAVDDTMADDPLLGELMKSGGTITSVEDSQGGTD
jgi:DNA polymerase III subunit gamma/tau